MRYLILFVLVAIAAAFSACSDRFRYPCQDPNNWDKPECKPPICTATVTCPDDLTKPHQTEQR
jgi:hypothetical protein